MSKANYKLLSRKYKPIKDEILDKYYLELELKTANRLYEDGIFYSETRLNEKEDWDTVKLRKAFHEGLKVFEKDWRTIK